MTVGDVSRVVGSFTGGDTLALSCPFLSGIQEKGIFDLQYCSADKVTPPIFRAGVWNDKITEDGRVWEDPYRDLPLFGDEKQVSAEKGIKETLSEHVTQQEPPRIPARQKNEGMSEQPEQRGGEITPALLKQQRNGR